MAANTLPVPPDQQTPVDSWPYREWFYRLWKAINELYSLVASASSSTNTTADNFVPYFIATGDTFTVPLYQQALFQMVIDNQGTIVVDGYLIQVD